MAAAGGCGMHSRQCAQALLPAHTGSATSFSARVLLARVRLACGLAAAGASFFFLLVTLAVADAGGVASDSYIFSATASSFLAASPQGSRLSARGCVPGGSCVPSQPPPSSSASSSVLMLASAALLSLASAAPSTGGAAMMASVMVVSPPPPRWLASVAPSAVSWFSSAARAVSPSSVCLLPML
ncbi:hypothetical protein T492DRAFT_926223 [Pavlovales sp. CCMP2436]|nr:hypothetical protein T492DRAFT_926223 [Pavlovales sp. CCMP2436]